MVLPRLRQVALVAGQLEPVVEQIQRELGLDQPYRDPGVRVFGLQNAVFSIGDTFLEVVAPREPDTAAGRYLERRGGDSGYMAMFQVADLDKTRGKLAELGVRVVWKADLDDIAGTHLHPRDVPGAIVSLDWADPEESWRWAGPAWTGGTPPHPPGGIVGLTIEVSEPRAVASRWAEVLDVAAPSDGREATVVLGDTGQHLRFTHLRDERGDGITDLTLAMAHPRTRVETKIGGVRLTVAPAAGEEQA